MLALILLFLALKIVQQVKTYYYATRLTIKYSTTFNGNWWEKWSNLHHGEFWSLGPNTSLYQIASKYFKICGLQVEHNEARRTDGPAIFLYGLSTSSTCRCCLRPYKLVPQVVQGIIIVMSKKKISRYVILLETPRDMRSFVLSALCALNKANLKRKSFCNYFTIHS